jgi:sensor domain CHASE-containing protein
MIYGTTYITSKKQNKPIKPELASYLQPESRLLPEKNINSPRKGLIQLPQGIVLVVARPILTGKGKGPIRGTLVMGRYLSKEYAGQIGKIIGLEFDLRSLKSFSKLGKLNIALDRIEPYPKITFQPLNEQVLASYTKLKDINGEPDLILQVQGQRVAYQQKQLSLHYLRISLVGLGLIAWGIALFLIAKLAQYLRERDRIQTILSEKQEALYQEKELAQITLQSIGDGVIATDAKQMQLKVYH